MHQMTQKPGCFDKGPWLWRGTVWRGCSQHSESDIHHTPGCAKCINFGKTPIPAAEADINSILADYLAGDKLQSIADKHGCSVAHVHVLAKRNGLKPRHDPSMLDTYRVWVDYANANGRPAAWLKFSIDKNKLAHAYTRLRECGLEPLPDKPRYRTKRKKVAGITANR